MLAEVFPKSSAILSIWKSEATLLLIIVCMLVATTTLYWAGQTQAVWEQAWENLAVAYGERLIWMQNRHVFVALFSLYHVCNTIMSTADILNSCCEPERVEAEESLTPSPSAVSARRCSTYELPGLCPKALYANTSPVSLGQENETGFKAWEVLELDLYTAQKDTPHVEKFTI